MKRQLIKWCILTLMLALGLAAHAQADAPEPWFTVNGSKTSATAAFNEAPTIRVYAPGATGVRLIAERTNPAAPFQHWYRYYSRNEFTNIVDESGMRMFDSGTWRITAAYTTEEYPDGEDLNQMEEIGWTPIGNGITVEVADYEGRRLDSPSASLSESDSTLTQGDLLTVTLSSLQGKGEWYWAELAKMNDDGEWVFLGHIDTDICENNLSFSLPTITLDPGSYRLELCTEAVGYEDNRVSLPFTLNASAGELPDMALYLPSVAVDATRGSALSYQQIMVYGYAEGADHMMVEVRMEGNPNWRDEIWLSGPFDYRNWSSSDDGTYTFTLHAWQDGNERVLNDTFTLIQTAPYNDLDEPDIQGLDNILPLGEGLDCSFPEVANAHDYHIELKYLGEDNDWEDVCQFFVMADPNRNGNIPIEVPAYAMNRPGLYWLQAHSHALGYNGGHANREFLVIEDEEALSGDIALLFSRESMQASEGMTVYGYAPGAEHMELDIRWDRDNNWWDDRDGYGEFNAWDWGCGSGGEYTFTLGVFYPEDSGKPDTEITRTFKVFSDGWLARPVLTGVPTIIQVDEDIHGSFQAIDGAEWYDIELQRVYEDGLWDELYRDHREPTAESDTSISIDLPGDLFGEAGIYRLSVNASAIGVDNGYTELRILAIPEPDPETSGDLTLKVYGKSEDADDLLLYQRFPIVLETPEGVTAARVWNGWDWDYWAGPNERFFREWDADWDGSITYVAQATTDASVSQWIAEHGDDFDGFEWDKVVWSLTSNQLTLSVECKGDLEWPDDDLPELELSEDDTIARGQPLHFSFSAIKDAAQYGVVIVPPGGDWEHNIYDENYLTAGSFSIPTDTMEPGDYTLIIDPRRIGWRGSAIGCYFTVVEPENWTDQASFSIARTEALTNEPIECSVYAPGAKEIRVCHETLLSRPWAAWADDHILCSLRADWPGEYEFLAYARYGEEDNGVDDWTQIGDAITVTATAPNGSLTGTLTAPAVVPAKEAYTFSYTWNCGEQWPDQAYIEIYDESDEEGEDLLEGLEIRGLAEGDVTDNGPSITYTYTLAPGALEPGSYRIEIGFHPAGYGYEWSQAEKTFFIVSDTPSEREIYTNLADEYETLFAPYVAVVAPGAQRITMWVSKQQSFDPDHPSTREVLDGDGDSVAGEVMFGHYAAPRYVHITAEYADGMSISKDMTVNVIAPNGPLHNSTMHMSGVWTEGENLSFRLETDDAWGYEIDVIDRRTGKSIFSDDDEDNSEYSGDCDEYGRVYCTIPASKFTPGHLYEIVAYTTKRGYDMDTTIFTLAMMPANPATMTLPAALNTVETEAFAGVAAQKIVIPSTVTSVAAGAFAGCNDLMMVEIPDGATGISKDAFDGSGTFMVYGTSGSTAEAFARSTVGNSGSWATFIYLD